MSWGRVNTKKSITFKARSEHEFTSQIRPYPASQNVPTWWKDLSPYDITPDNPTGKFRVRNRASNASAKKCVPMLDSITGGYIVPLFSDVNVEQNTDGFPLVTWRTNIDVFYIHGLSSREVPAPPGYDQVVFKYNNCWIPETPTGYSTLVTAPVGFRGLPFQAIPAIIDTDSSKLELIFPCWIKSGFEGIVEKGTPMVQLTPFKREEWKSEFTYYENNEYKKIEDKYFNSTLINNYIKNHWTKKTYK